MRRNGFTLIEILVALVVLGFLLAGLTQGVRFGVQAWGMQTRRIARVADMDAAMRAVRRLVEQADPGDSNDPGTMRGGAHTLSFTSRLPEAAAAGEGRGADVAIGVDQQHELVLRASFHLHAQRLAPSPPPLQSVLVAGVDHVDFAYYRAAGRQPAWASKWDEDDLPNLVRMHVVFLKGDKRHWPDMIALTRMQRSDE